MTAYQDNTLQHLEQHTAIHCNWLQHSRRRARNDEYHYAGLRDKDVKMHAIQSMCACSCVCVCVWNCVVVCERVRVCVACVCACVGVMCVTVCVLVCGVHALTWTVWCICSRKTNVGLITLVVIGVCTRIWQSRIYRKDCVCKVCVCVRMRECGRVMYVCALQNPIQTCKYV